VSLDRVPQLQQPSEGSTRRCEDCDGSLEARDSVDGMDYEMMDDGGEGPSDEHACRGCRRIVCGLCSIDRGGRVCLGCAT